VDDVINAQRGVLLKILAAVVEYERGHPGKLQPDAEDMYCDLITPDD